MLDVKRMTILQAVVAAGSMTAAAKQLGYTPSAISQHITALERQAGTALLERVGRGVRATPAGRLLTEHAAIIGSQVAEAETALVDLREGRTGRLSIGYFATSGASLMAPALADLSRKLPGVRVDLKLIYPDDPWPDVLAGRSDLAIVVRTDGVTASGINLVHLLDDPYRAVLPVGHRLAAKRTVDLADLADEQWVSSEWPGPCRDAMLAGCTAAGFSPNFVIESEDYASAQGFVAAGLGISLIPLMGLASRHSGVVVRRVRRPEPARTIYAAMRATTTRQPALDALVTALRSAARRVGR